MAPRTPLLQPTEYFRRRDRPSLAIATGIVVVQAVALAATIQWFVSRVFAQIDLSEETMAQVQGAVGGAVVLVFFSTLLGWGLVAAVIHLFVWFADGRNVGRTLAVVGESQLVALVFLPVTVFLLNLQVGQVPADPDAAVRFLERTASRSSPLLLLSGFVTTLWMAGIQGVGLAETHDISRDKTFLVAFGLGIFGFLINLL